MSNNDNDVDDDDDNDDGDDDGDDGDDDNDDYDYDDVLLQLLAVVEVHLLCLQLAFGSHTPSAVMHLLTF